MYVYIKFNYFINVICVFTTKQTSYLLFFFITEVSSFTQVILRGDNISLVRLQCKFKAQFIMSGLPKRIKSGSPAM